jgi:hypothetical protein
MRRTTLAVLTVAHLSGCVAWRPQNVGPRELLAANPQEVIRVATADSAKGIVVYQPRIVGDTLTGHPTETAILRLAIPVRDVTQVSTRYRHLGKTMIAGMAIVGGVLVYGLLQSLNGTTP